MKTKFVWLALMGAFLYSCSSETNLDLENSQGEELEVITEQRTQNSKKVIFEEEEDIEVVVEQLRNAKEKAIEKLRKISEEIVVEEIEIIKEQR